MSHFVKNIFQTPLLVGHSDNLQIRQKICDLVLHFRDTVPSAKLVSEGWNYGKVSALKEDFQRYGVTSFSTEAILDKPEWQEVSTFLKVFAQTMISSVNTGDSVMTFMNSWITLYPPGTYVPEHVHSNSMLSGVFYAHVPENGGNLIFKDPSAVAKTMYIRHYNDFPTVPTIYTHVVESGQMVIFPAWLPHMTEANQSNENRIMVSFNIDMKDPM